MKLRPSSRYPRNLLQKLRQHELSEVRQAIAAAKQRALKITDLENVDLVGTYAAAPAITLDEIEQSLTTNDLTAPLMHPHPDHERTYLVEVGGEKWPLTFDPDVYDQNPEIGFATYGQPQFEVLLDEALGS